MIELHIKSTKQKHPVIVDSSSGLTQPIHDLKKYIYIKQKCYNILCSHSLFFCPIRMSESPVSTTSFNLCHVSKIFFPFTIWLYNIAIQSKNIWLTGTISHLIFLFTATGCFKKFSAFKGKITSSFLYLSHRKLNWIKSSMLFNFTNVTEKQDRMWFFFTAAVHRAIYESLYFVDG